MFKVLLVEDDNLVRDTMVRRLRNIPTVEVTAAVNGADGLRCLETESFDFVISDVDMPVMNGRVFLQHVTKQFPHLLANFVFFTGAPDSVEGLGVRVLEKLETSAVIGYVKELVGVGTP